MLLTEIVIPRSDFYKEKNNSFSDKSKVLKILKIELEDNGYVVKEKLTLDDQYTISLELHYADSKANRELYEEYAAWKPTKGKYYFFEKTVDSYRTDRGYKINFVIVPHMLMIEIF